jgi:nitrogen fixation/metabolism regulation signal transduction histidine kinase
MIAQSRHAAMGEMIGMIAHQWRQPLSVISMGANNMLVDIELEEMEAEKVKQYSYGILRQTEYLSKTIDDFRNFFRPDKALEEVKLEDILDEAQKIIGKTLEHSNIALHITCNQSYRVKTYSRELLQVYINLLKNAKEALVEHTSSQRRINVTLFDDEMFIFTKICDNGGGIDATILSRIFEPYFSTKDEKTGTGLGLYMSKTIIEKHLHGTIEVQNTDDGVCFIVAIAKNRQSKEEKVDS